MNQFETELRAEVKHRSRWKNHEESIQEISQHFQDLCDEYISDGLTEKEAAGQACLRFGDIKEIAQRLTMPSTATKGVRYQWWAIACWIFFVFSPLLIEMNGYVVGSLWGNFIEFWTKFAPGAVIASGVFLAAGIFRAKRLSISAALLGFVMIPVGFLGHILLVYKSFDHYNQSMNRSHVQMIRYRDEIGPAFLARQGQLGNCLKSPTFEQLSEFAAGMHSKKINGFEVRDSGRGKWFYPTAYQKLREGGVPVVFFATTDSFDQAKTAWSESDKLRKLMPTMTALASSHFEFFAHVDINDSRLEVVTRRFWIEATIPFASGVFVGLLTCGLFTVASRRIRPYRRLL